MIDAMEFAAQWHSLCRRFNRQENRSEMREYLEFLNPQLTTEEFRVASRELWANREFFPKPGDFVTAGKGSPEARAIDDWNLCALLMEGSQKALGRMSEAGRKTVALMGGVDRLRNTPIEEVHFRRAEFLRLHHSAQEIHRRESPIALPPMSSEGQRVIAKAVPKLLGDSSETVGV